MRLAYWRSSPTPSATTSSDDVIVKDFDPTLTSLQRDVLELLHVPISVYVSETAS